MSDANSPDQLPRGFEGWTPFAVMFHPDGSVAKVVGPDEGDPYSLLGSGDVWSFDTGELDGEWIENVDLSIESSIVAGRAAATYNALLDMCPNEGDPPRPEEIVDRLTTFIQLWTSSPLNEYILRELSCELLASIACLVDLVDRDASSSLLRQHGDAADREWTEPELCCCRALDDATSSSDGSQSVSGADTPALE